MKRERSILFSTPMVVAIKEGRKTQARLVVEPQPVLRGGLWEWREVACMSPEVSAWLPDHCPYGQPGDLIYVRETWQALRFYRDWESGHVDWWEEISPEEVESEGSDSCFVFKAFGDWDDDKEDRGFNWRPSIHMPKAAARIWLEITEVRVQRLQDISTEDLQAEGVVSTYARNKARREQYAREEFAGSWNKIYEGPSSWESSPWVWAATFRILSTTGRP